MITIGLLSPAKVMEMAEDQGDTSVLVAQESLGQLCPSRNDSEDRIAKSPLGSLALFCLQTGWQTREAEMNI